MDTRTIRSSSEYGERDKDVGEFVPRIVSWNTTFRCNLRCPHCYLNAGEREERGELTTTEGINLIDRIAQVSAPLLILSGGEPLLRPDIYQLARYATDRGLKVALGTNGTHITGTVAERLREAGVTAVAISLDSTHPEIHDTFRGVKGSWKKAVTGIESCRQSGIGVQVNTTVTPDNLDDIPNILTLAASLGARSFHLFFLVPTGRGTHLPDLSPLAYEQMIADTLQRISTCSFPMAVRPVCAPQFLRIAIQNGMDPSRWESRGCVAGRSYCRIFPTGEVTPCPYLPLSLGNIRDRDFRDIWFHSPVLGKLRDRRQLGGKCGRCEYREICGGCRARAYGMTGAAHPCGGLDRPEGNHGDYLAEEPACPYQPGNV